MGRSATACWLLERSAERSPPNPCRACFGRYGQDCRVRCLQGWGQRTCGGGVVGHTALGTYSCSIPRASSGRIWRPLHRWYRELRRHIRKRVTTTPRFTARKGSKIEILGLRGGPCPCHWKQSFRQSYGAVHRVNILSSAQLCKFPNFAISALIPKLCQAVFLCDLS